MFVLTFFRRVVPVSHVERSSLGLSSIRQCYVFAFYHFVLSKYICPGVLMAAQAKAVLAQSQSLSVSNTVAMKCI